VTPTSVSSFHHASICLGSPGTSRVIEAISSFMSDKSIFGERVAPVRADDDVVENSHIDEGQRTLDRVRDRAIRHRRFWRAGWVIVREDDRGGVHLYRALQDLARIDGGLRQGSTGCFEEFDEAVLRIEEHHAENLVFQAPEPQPKPVARDAGES
jgi:hypothetical protein